MSDMRIGKSIFLAAISCAVFGAANANWQYSGTYVRDGWYADDGARFVLSFRGGAALGRGTIKNDIGALSSEYYYNPADGMVISAAYYDECGAACSGVFGYAGVGNIADLPPSHDYSELSFAAGGSLGWTIPNAPQWRIEIGWDHVSEAEYNASPMFDGELTLTGGNFGEMTISAQSGGVQSTVTTDIISAMAFYDFFDGIQKPLRQAIPYVGFGLGYADVQTVLNLSDLYGDLSTSIDLTNFGELDDYNVLQFYRSETHTSNIAGVVAAGVSYGLADGVFMDIGARIAYVPKIKWALTNADDTRNRDWFSAENMIFANVMLGLRFEF